MPLSHSSPFSTLPDEQLETSSFTILIFIHMHSCARTQIYIHIYRENEAFQDPSLFDLKFGKNAYPHFVTWHGLLIRCTWGINFALRFVSLVYQMSQIHKTCSHPRDRWKRATLETKDRVEENERYFGKVSVFIIFVLKRSFYKGENM